MKNPGFCLTLWLLLPLAIRGEPQSYSYYNLFWNCPSSQMFITDGWVCEGPFRANDTVRLYSTSPGRDQDPWFYSFTLSAYYYLYGNNPPGIQCTFPQQGNLWIEPFEKMSLGVPWFELGVTELPFGADQVDWQTVRSTAQSGGLFINVDNGARIVLRDSLLLLRNVPGTTHQQYDLSVLTCPVVWLGNYASDRIYIRGDSLAALTVPLTIGTFGDLYLSGELVCEGEGILGLVTVFGDLVIADDPEMPEPGWSGFEIVTDRDLSFMASMMALEGDFMAEAWSQPSPQAVFTLQGGIQVQSPGYTGSPVSGFKMEYHYDERLFTEGPPYYPQFNFTGSDREDLLPVVTPVLKASQNPFSGSTVISSPGPGTLTFLDASGRTVITCEITSELTIYGEDLPDGVYLVVYDGGTGEVSSITLAKID